MTVSPRLREAVRCALGLAAGSGLLIALLHANSVSVRAADRVLTLSTSHVSPRSTPEKTGFQDRILQEAFSRVGVGLAIIHLPSERALANANSGVEDGNFARVEGMEAHYPNLAMVPEPVTSFAFTAFTKNAAIAVADWRDLAPYNVGIITGWKILESNIRQARSLTTVKDTQALFQLLEGNRVDLVVYDKLQGLAEIKRQGGNAARPLSPPLAVRPMFLYLHKRHADLVPLLAKALRDMREEGAIEALTNAVLDQAGLQ